MGATGLIKPHRSKFDLLFRLSDAALVFGLYHLILVYGHAPWSERDLLIAICASGGLLFVGSAVSLYQSWRMAPLHNELARVFLSWAIVVVCLLFLIFLLGHQQQDLREGIIIWLAATPVALIAWRLAARQILRVLRRHDFNTRRVAIVGMTEVGVNLAKDIESAPWTGMHIAGFYDDRDSADRVCATGLGPALGSLNDLTQHIDHSDIDVVFITLPFAAESRIAALLGKLKDTTVSVYFAHDYRGFDLLHGSWFIFGNTPVVSIFETPFLGIEGLGKRVQDLFIATIALILLSPLLLSIAVAIKATSPGPVLFKQRRYGLDGREILVWKFRTMHTASDDHEVKQATRNDARVTRVGRFLRCTSLDELPQLVNVLSGSMSIVGPRPLAVAHNEEYRKLIPSYMQRHKVKPGITGLAQVNGWRGEIEAIDDIQHRVDFDLQYIRTWSQTLDLEIIFRTLRHGFIHDKAY